MARVHGPDDRSRLQRWVLGPGAVALAVSVVVAVLTVGRSAGRGLYLVRDFVSVPDPVAPLTLVPDSWAALRAWPLDGVMWALTRVMPAGVVQLAMVTACFVLAGTGVGVLVGRLGGLPAALGAFAATWNPYVTERLLMGQPPTLLAYAAVPWIILAARSPVAGWRRFLLVGLAALPAAVTPWGGVVAGVTAFGATLTRAQMRRSDLAGTGITALLLCLPWLVPAVILSMSGAARSLADADGVAAFALADDTGHGVWLSAVTGGGIWAEAARPDSRLSLPTFVSAVLLLSIALAAALTLPTRHSGKLAATAGLLLPASLLSAASTSGLGLFGRLQAVPGMALLRDQHRLLGFAVIAQALLLAALVGQLRRWGSVAPLLAGLTITSLVVASVPDQARSLAAIYRPVTFPSSWGQVVQAVEEEQAAMNAPAVVLSLPWQPLRRPTWGSRTPFLDPTPRGVPAVVLTSSELNVRRGESVLVVDDEPYDVGHEWGRGELTPSTLRAHAVTHVLEWLETPGDLARSHEGWHEVLRTSSWVLWRVSSTR